MMEEVIRAFTQEISRLAMRLGELEYENKGLQEKLTIVESRHARLASDYFEQCEKKLTEITEKGIDLTDLMDKTEAAPQPVDAGNIVNTSDVKTKEQEALDKAVARKEYMKTYMKKKRAEKKQNGNSAEK